MGGQRGINGERRGKVVKECVQRIHRQSQRREGLRVGGGGRGSGGWKMETTVHEQQLKKRKIHFKVNMLIIQSYVFM